MGNECFIDRERHIRIKYEMEMRGVTFSQIAQEAKVGISAVSSVSVGKSRSSRLESMIAKSIGTTAAQLFPERYVGVRIKE